MQSEPRRPGARAGRGCAPQVLFALPAALCGMAGLFCEPRPRPEPGAVGVDRQASAGVLPPVQGRTLGLSKADLLGTVSLVNVFASWCVECRAEHPLLMRLAREKTVPIHGLNYKDAHENAARWLNTMGDPYSRTGADLDRRVSIDWGVYGVPETFVVGADGVIAYTLSAPFPSSALADTILPLIARLRQAATGANHETAGAARCRSFYRGGDETLCHRDDRGAGKFRLAGSAQPLPKSPSPTAKARPAHSPIFVASSCCSTSGRPGASLAERRCRRSTGCKACSADLTFR
jgi:cytochrome c biogenesis protein CcmG/thiol:disulfide interchange protein DsbE